MGAAMDGAMMYILSEGWKEFKVGCIFDIVQQPTFDKETLEWEDLGHAAQITYVAHLGRPGGLWPEAVGRSLSTALDAGLGHPSPGRRGGLDLESDRGALFRQSAVGGLVSRHRASGKRRRVSVWRGEHTVQTGLAQRAQEDSVSGAGRSTRPAGCKSWLPARRAAPKKTYFAKRAISSTISTG